MNIIERNFFRILRSGAFNDKEAIEPMSPFKWRRLLQVVEAQNIVATFAKGINNHENDPLLNIPTDITRIMPELIVHNEERKHAISNDDVRMNNFFLNRKLKNIIAKELKDEESSVETIDLLEIIVYNLSTILNRGLSLDGIMQLGEYLRRWGDKVDFVKLDNWLDSLHLRRMAQLQGSILMSVFGFEQDELPFVEHPDKEALRLAVKTITYQTKDTAEEWHFKQSRSGFVQNNTTVMRRNILRSIRYYRYAPLETVSSFFGNIGRSLSEIEE
ncbi:MAG: hypothetical protein J5610_02140 [Prevotella sp.]|nr:hypothetical protein [Prevotella sp.]